MNTKELKKKLNKLGIKEFRYSLNGTLDDDRLILYKKDYNVWEVFYFERGIKEDRKIFNTEDDACQYIYNFFDRVHKIEIKYGLK